MGKDDFFDMSMFTVIALLLLVLVVVLALLSTIFPDFGFVTLVFDNEVVLVVLMIFAFVVGPIVGMVIEEVVNSRKKYKSGEELENDSNSAV